MTNPPNVDRTVPVSREDYDRMADQRDRFRAALVEVESYFDGVARSLADAVEPLDEMQACDHPTDAAEARLHLDAALASAVGCAQHGSEICRKALKAR